VWGFWWAKVSGFLDINGSTLSLEGNLLPEPNKIKKGKGRIYYENG
jgi:hypothetical protein